MKNLFSISGAILLIILIHSCKKDKPTPPVITTTSVTEISYTTATSGGDVTSEGGVPVVSEGVCWNTSADPTIADSKTAESGGSIAFTSKLTQLTPNTLYYLRAYATNSAGTGYGNQVTFTTSQIEVPVLTTTAITSITQTTAMSGGNITDDKGGSVSEKGICWGTETNPTIANSKTSDGSGTGNFSSSISGLSVNSTYYVRAYAINNAGTGYGNVISFKTRFGDIILFKPGLWYDLITDIEGNLYKAITIGTQTWMAENLKTIRYNDGTTIPLVTDASIWADLSTPAYCWYDNDESTYKSTFGALYNWYAVNTGKLCPIGWHIPTDAEWTKLLTYLGSENVAGGKLKETGTTHWNSPNTGATNESGFTAFPGGIRVPYYISADRNEHIGSFVENQIGGYFWKSSYGTYLNTKSDANQVFIHSSGIKSAGISVRCIKE